MQLQIAPPQLISESFGKELGSLVLSSLDVHVSYEFNSPGNQTAFENLAVNHTCSWPTIPLQDLCSDDTWVVEV